MTEKPAIDLRDFHRFPAEQPRDGQTVIVGYRYSYNYDGKREYLPGMLYGVGYMQDGYWWLGPRGLDPHYQRVPNADVFLWRELLLPRNEGSISNWISWSDLPEVEE